MNVHNHQLNLSQFKETAVYQGKNFFRNEEAWDEFAALAALWVTLYQTDHVVRVARFYAGRFECKTIEVLHDETWQSYLSRVQQQEWQLDYEQFDIWVQVDESIAPMVGELPRFYLRQNKNGVVLLGYHSELLEPNELSMLSYTISELLLNIRPEKKISGLLTISAEQQQLIFGELNDTSRNFKGLDCIESLIRNAEEAPRETAFIFQDARYTFQEFLDEVVSLSTALQELTHSGDLVGVHMERGIHTVTALFAIWHAGCAWLPLSVDYTTSMLAEIVYRTKPKVVLQNRSLDPSKNIEDCDYKVLEDLLAQGKTEEDAAPRRFVDSDEVAAVMFTSGSTGRPNAIAHSFRSLNNRFQWFKEQYSLDENAVFVHRTALTFIPSLTEMVCGMLVGRSVAIASEHSSRDPRAICDLVEVSAATHITLLPSFLLRLLAMNNDVVDKLATLKYITVAGETLSYESLRFIRMRLPNVTIINDYGCTETNGVLIFDTKQSNIRAERLPAGKPIANCQAFVLNEEHKPVPFGVLGALHIGGICLGDGYLDNPELNASRFIVIDLPNGKKARLFNTNDHARILPSGNIEVLGRLDNVVKLRGIRVELESVDHALGGLPYISEGASVAIPNSRGEYELAAFVKFVDDKSRPSSVQIRKDLMRHIPDAAIPNRIFALDVLPKTANGKLARKELVKLAAQNITEVRAPGKVGVSADILDTIIGCLASILECEKTAINPSDSFKLLGLDSIKLVDYCENLETKLKRRIPVSLLFEKSTPQELANFIVEGNRQERLHPIHSRNLANEDVAIVGMACRMPGANDVSEFWQLLKSGKSAVGEIPSKRFDWRQYYTQERPKADQIVSKWGAFIDDIEGFDPYFFNISDREARVMSPEQRLWLMTSWQALADAGFAERDVNGRSVGVFVGARAPDYISRLRDAGEPISALTLMGSDSAILASRLAYFLNLKGPSITYDTACSSSLLSVIEACKSIASGGCEMAIAGGVSAITNVDQYLANSRAGMLSPRGLCSTFDASADGFVQGEGVAAFVLKPLSNAIADGDVIYSVIKGYAVNQDGKTNGITAPNGEAQRALLFDAYEHAGVSPEQLGLIEAHGTGTKLGDPIEFSALADFFKHSDVPHSNCALGSVKTNIGHLIGAAGVAGLMKAVLSVYHAHIPPTLNVEKVNEHIALDESPFYIPKEGGDWKNPSSRFAGVSAFGFSGTNCHLVLSNFEVPYSRGIDAPKTAREGYFIPLSGRSEAGLRNYANNLKFHLESSAMDIAEFAQIMAKRFNNFEWRSLMFGSSLSDIQVALAAVVADEAHPNLLFSGRASSDLPYDFFAKSAAKLSQEISDQGGGYESNVQQAIATFFKNDISIDFKALAGHGAPRAQSHIPPYPFERGEYWVENMNAYDTSFIEIERENYKDHRVNGEVWLPLSGMILEVADALGQGNCFSIKRLNVFQPVNLSKHNAIVELTQSEEIADSYTVSNGNNKIANLQFKSRCKIKMNTNPRNMVKTFAHVIRGADFYERARLKGLSFGPDYNLVDRVFYSKNRAMAFVNFSGDSDRHQAALLDSAFQTTLAILPQSDLFVPIGLSEFELSRAIPSQFFCAVQLKNEEVINDELVSFFVSLCDSHGNVFATIKDFQLKKFLKKTKTLEENYSVEAKKQPKPVTSCMSYECSDSFAFGVWVPKLDPLPLDVGSESKKCLFGIFPGSLPELEEGCETVKYGEERASVKRPQRWLWKPENTELTDLLKEFVMYVNWLLENVEHPELAILHSGNSVNIAALSGAAYAAQQENPELSCKVIHSRSRCPIGAQVFETGNAVEVEFRDNEMTSRRWALHDHNIKLADSKDERHNPVCVITGGMGNVGRELCNWLIDNKNARIAIVGRRPLRDSEEKQIRTMRLKGAEVAYFNCDLSSLEACAKLIAKIERRFLTIDRVYHCAGVARDSLLINKKSSEIEEVVKAKVSSIQCFDEAIGERPIEMLAVFSSVSAIKGTMGQSDYGAANAWLDKYVAQRNSNPQKSGHAISVNWALWDGPGMDPGDRRRAQLKEQLGMVAMHPAKAIDLLDQLWAEKVEQAVIAYGIPEKLENWLNTVH